MKAELEVSISRGKAMHEVKITLEGEPEDVVEVTNDLLEKYGDMLD